MKNRGCKRKSKGQSTLEYTVLLIVVMGALLSMQNYIKRSIQGRWKATIDDMGDQYDPRITNSFIIHTIMSNQTTTITAKTYKEGWWTDRVDISNTVEKKVGSMTVGSN